MDQIMVHLQSWMAQTMDSLKSELGQKIAILEYK